MSAEDDALDEVTPELVRRIEGALADGRNDEAKRLLEELSPVGQAAVLEQVAEPEREALVGLLRLDLDPEVRHNVFPNSRLKGAANLVICPSLDSANIAFNLLKTAADGLHVGPMLLGTSAPAHVLTPSVTARGILNMTGLSVVEAQRRAEARG